MIQDDTRSSKSHLLTKIPITTRAPAVLLTGRHIIVRLSEAKYQDRTKQMRLERKFQETVDWRKVQTECRSGGRQLLMQILRLVQEVEEMSMVVSLDPANCITRKLSPASSILSKPM